MNQLNLRSIFKESWVITRQGLQPILGAAAVTFGILMGSAMIMVELFARWQGLDLTVDTDLATAVDSVQFLLVLLLAPFEGALAIMGWRRATEQPIRLGMVFSGWRFAAPLALIALMTSVLVNLGLFLMVVPGIYLMAVCSQANLYYLLKGGSPTRAMLESAKVVHRNLLVVLSSYALIIVLLALSAIPLGLGLFLTVPLFFHMKGVLFRGLFPEFTPGRKPVTLDATTSDDGHFEA